MIYCIDIDGSICRVQNADPRQYSIAEPIPERIKEFNELYDQGHEIHYWTSRGALSGKDWKTFTRMQLKDWGVKYTKLKFNKPHYDVWIDDKAFNVNSYFESNYKEVAIELRKIHEKLDSHIEKIWTVYEGLKNPIKTVKKFFR